MEKSEVSADRESEMPGGSELRDLFSRVPVALYRTDEEGNLLTANKALATLLGYEDFDDMVVSLESVESVYVDPGARKRWTEEMRQKGLVFDFDVEFKRADGSTIWVQDTARAIRDDKGNLMYYEGALIDVTEKVTATKARDEFLATVSHELRNPVTAVVGLSHELAERYESFSEEERRDMIEMIARQAEDASWLIEDLLIAYREDVSKVSISPEEFDVVSEVQRVLEVAERDVKLEVHSADPTVLADPRRTRQIIRNLVTNALNHGGEEVMVRVDDVDARVRIHVCDSGDAILEDELVEIFQAFRTGKRTHHPSSVGLGLPVARELARLMGGDVTYQHDGSYSWFTLSLPTA